MRTTSIIWEKPPVKKHIVSIKDTEKERWHALLHDRNPLVLTMEPLKYGPLTPEGFLTVTRSDSVIGNSRFPKEPASLVSLLLALDADEDSVIELLHAYKRAQPESYWPPVRTVESYELFLKAKGITPSPRSLVKLLEEFQWRDAYQRLDIVGVPDVFSAMTRFCQDAEDVNYLMNNWLPNFTLLGSEPGEMRLSHTLAREFPEGGTEALVAWCRQNNDLQGLGYLVWQERLPLHEWLVEAAQTRASNMAERRERLQTLLGVLGAYSSTSLDDKIVHLDCEIFSSVYGHEIKNLVESVANEGSSMESLQWIATLCAIGAVPYNHSSVLSWLDTANVSLDERCTQLSSSGSESGRFSFAASWFRTWAPALADKSQVWCNYLGRRLVLDISLSSAEKELAASHPITWLGKADVLDALKARSCERNGSIRDLFVSLVPMVSYTHLPLLGSYVTQWCARDSLSARTVRSQWKQWDPARYGQTIPNQFSYTDDSLILYALTRKDPKDLLVMMREMKIHGHNDAYRSMVETWIASSFDLTQKPVTMPDVDFNTTDLG